MAKRDTTMLSLDVHLTLARAESMLVTSRSGGRAWLPRSLIEVEPGGVGNTLRIRVPKWLAEQEGLISTVGDGQGSLL